MTVRPTPSPSGISRFDNDVAQAVNLGANVAAFPVDLFRNAIDRIQRLKIQDPRDKKGEMPTLLGTARRIKNWLLQYHHSTLVFGSEKSGYVEQLADSFFKKVFIPLSFFQTGRVIQEAISSRLASVARIIAFGLTQFFHVLPYVFGAALITGGVFLYKTSPVALITAVLGTTVVYILLKGIEVINYNLEMTLASEQLFNDRLVQIVANEADKLADKKIEAVSQNVKVWAKTLPIIGRYITLETPKEEKEDEPKNKPVPASNERRRDPSS